MNAAASGEALLTAGKFTEAIDAFNIAIQESPSSPDYFIKRSMAYHKSKIYEAALSDCENAVALAYKRGNRGMRATAQFRRSLALFCLDRPKDAKFCLDKAVADGCKEKSIAVWQVKIDQAAAADASDLISVTEIPQLDVELTTKAVLETKENTVEDKTPSSAELDNIPISIPTAYKKPNFEWYQNTEKVIVTFYVRNIPKDRCNVEIKSNSLSLSFPIPESGSEYAHEFEALYSLVDPIRSSFRVLGTKIEISLHKANPGKWSSLEASEAPAEVKIAYPTSSRTGPKNWDTVAATGEDDKKDGDAALTDLFQTLYKDADEDTRKAMIKSYTESGGTSLSTDWSSVKKGKVEIKAPDGMEARTYGR